VFVKESEPAIASGTASKNYKPTVARKTEHIVAALRTEIVQGLIRPESQLPTLKVLEERFQVGQPTVIRALDWLKRDGFVYADSTRGNFVSSRPPHLHRYGIVFGRGPNDWDWNRYWAGLASGASAVGQRRQLDMTLFYGIGQHQTVSESYRQLQREMDTERLAGLIVVATESLMSEPFLSRPMPAKVAIAASDLAVGSVPRVDIDRQSFITRSLKYLASRGRRRVAVLTNASDRFPEYPARISDFGLSAEPYWFLVGVKHGAGNIVRLLMNPKNPERPDSLIITDDNMVESAVAGLVATGVKVPEELEVVAHCNWPFPVASVVPVKRLGFDIRQVIETCLDVLEGLRRGETVAPIQLLPAMFEDEVLQDSRTTPSW
jgi:DNA-binding LacI/PurR family transcriptional regulator